MNVCMKFTLKLLAQRGWSCWKHLSCVFFCSISFDDSCQSVAESGPAWRHVLAIQVVSAKQYRWARRIIPQWDMEVPWWEHPIFSQLDSARKKNHNYVVGLEAGLHGHKMSTKIQHENLQSRLSSLYLLNVFDQTMRIILFKSTDARTRHLFVSLRADQHLKHKKSRSYKEIEAPLSFWLGRPKK
jgi:hypothetical protein